MIGSWEKVVRGFMHFLSAQHGFTAVQTVVCTVAAVAAAGTIGTVVVESGDESSKEIQQAVYQSIQNIQGTFIIKGPVYGKAAGSGPEAVICQMVFDVALVSSDGFIDFTPPEPSPENNGLAGPDSQNLIVISYTDEFQHVENLFWTVDRLGKDDGDMILEENELFQITIGGSLMPGKYGGNLADALESDLSRETAFSLQIGAPQCATFIFESKTPSCIKKVNEFR